jgi:hypothetical protein
MTGPNLFLHRDKGYWITLRAAEGTVGLLNSRGALSRKVYGIRSCSITCYLFAGLRRPFTPGRLQPKGEKPKTTYA